jgi:2-polyprenyl-3-methyl-5-hydroxy-6-metoxy-1,4-benzoquinol methylase
MAESEKGRLARAVAWLAERARPGARTVATPAVLAHKQQGAELARAAYAAGLAGPGLAAPEHPELVRLGGRLCRQADIESPWLRHWCARLGMAPLYHRKVWEECFVTQALWEAGMLAPNRRGLGFACGRELLPSFLAAHGAEVLATDLDAADRRAQGWQRTAQHAADAEHLFHPHLVARDEFDALVRFRPVDMNAIPADLRQGRFDFLWSVCSFEHLGSIEKGLDFVLAAMACLRPGGVAVHTTEYRLDEAGPTIARGTTVLFERRHIEALGRRLAEAGHRLLPVDFAAGQGALDGFVDLPPFTDAAGAPLVADTPHLALALRGHRTTSIGLIVRAAR